MRRRTIVLISVPVVAVFALGAALLATRSARATIEGTVVFAPGRPARGYVVYAELYPPGTSGTVRSFPVLYPREWTATTDALGRYRMTNVRTDGEVWIGVVEPGRGVGAFVTLDQLRPGETETLDLSVSRPASPRR